MEHRDSLLTLTYGNEDSDTMKLHEESRYAWTIGQNMENRNR